VVTPEMILSLGAEEGSITLYGVKLNGDWHFLLKYDRFAPLDLFSHEEVTDKNLFLEETSFQKGFNNAIELLDEYPWHMLIPRLIHPEFATQLLTEVENRFESEHFRLTYWRRLVSRSLLLTQMVH
jgi:hypothetical protein